MTKSETAGQDDLEDVELENRSFARPLEEVNPEGTVAGEPSVQLRALDEGEKVGDDVSVIVLMGPTGTGKSNFIETLGQRTTKWNRVVDIATATLVSVTQDVTGYRMEHQNLNLYTKKPIILLDTPGFNDARISELRIVLKIKMWMLKRGVKSVDRLFYMNSITDNRVPRTKKKSLMLFKAFCGAEAANRMVVVTTMWDLIWNERLRAHADYRFELLKQKHWKDFLDQGSRMETFDNTFESAVKTLQALGPPTQVTGQAFAFEKKVAIKDTDMGRQAFEALIERYENLDVGLQVVEQDIRQSVGMQNKELDSLLLKQKTEITYDLKQVTKEMQKYSLEYKPFSDAVHQELDRPGLPDAATTKTSNSTHKSGGRVRSKLDKLKELTRGRKGTARPTAYDPPVNLPNIRQFIETGKVTGTAGDSNQSDDASHSLT